MSKDKDRNAIVRNGVVEDGPKAKDPHDFGRDGPSIAYANLQRTGLPTQYDKERALDQAVRDMIRQDVRAFSNITSRGGAVPDRPVVRRTEPTERPLGPPPHVDFVDRMIDAHLGPVRGKREPKKDGGGEAA